MSTAITPLATQDLAHQPEQNILAVIARASSDPNVDVAKMNALLDLQERIMAKQAEASYTSALLNAKRSLRDVRITKDGKITYKDGSKIKYAKYENIADYVQPILYENGLIPAYTFEFLPNPPKVVAVMKLRHIGGFKEEFRSVPLPMIDSSGGKNDLQGAGSVSSYGKRYVVCPALDIITENEDYDGSGEGIEPITPDQASNIRNLLAEYGRSEERFLQFMKVSSVEEIQQRQYIGVVQKIKTRAK